MVKKYSRIIALLLIFPIVTLACSLSISRPEPTPIPPLPPVPTVEIQAPISPATPIVVSPSIITDEDSVLIDLYNRLNPSVVNIITYTSQGNLVMPTAQGSGFIYDTQGYIVTNAHVVHGSSEVEIIFSDGSTYPVEIIGQDLHSDLAVIKVDSLPAGVQPIPLADINSIAVGQTVIAIGNPFGLGGTLTRGIVSALGRNIPALTSFSIPQAIQTDAPINPGNSGGPLLNLKGEVIGVNAQIETDGISGTNSGVGFAIPVSIVQRVIPELIRNGEYTWGWLGVRGGDLTAVQIEAMGLSIRKGAYLSEVIADGPSSKAGLRGSNNEMTVNNRLVETGGDIIIAVDGQAVNNFDDLLIYIALNTTPGQTIELTIIRDNQTQQIQVTLEPRPQETMILP